MRVDKGILFPKFGEIFDKTFLSFRNFVNKKTKKFDSKWGDMIYAVSLIVFIITSIIVGYFVYANTVDNYAIRVIRFGAVLAAVLKIIVFDLRKYTTKRMLIVLAVFLVVLISTLVSSSKKIPLYTIVMIIAAYGVDFKKLLRTVFVWETFLVIMIILLSILGVIPDRLFSRGDIVRHSLGFKYCIYASAFYFCIVCMYLYLRRDKIKIWECLFIILPALILYLLTNTRLEFGLTVLVTVWFFIYQRWPREAHKKAVRIIALASVPFALIFSLFSVQFYNPDNSIWAIMNRFSSDRLALSSEMFNEYGISLFGKDIEWVGLSQIYEGNGDIQDFNAVDNLYLRLLIENGLLVLLVFAFGQYMLAREAIKRDDYYLQFIAIMFVCYSMLNPNTYELFRDPFLLLLGGAVISTGTKRDRNGKK